MNLAVDQDLSAIKFLVENAPCAAAEHLARCPAVPMLPWLLLPRSHAPGRGAGEGDRRGESGRGGGNGSDGVGEEMKGEGDGGVSREAERARRWRVGDRVEGRYSNGDWYGATIVAVKEGGERSAKERGKRRKGSARRGVDGDDREEAENGVLYELEWEDGGKFGSSSDVRVYYWRYYKNDVSLERCI